MIYYLIMCFFLDMRRNLTILFLSALPSISFAECGPDSIPYFFHLAEADAQPYGVFLGQITDMQIMSEGEALTKDGRPVNYYDYVAEFSGRKGNRQGFTEPVSGNVQIKAVEVEGIATPFSLPPIGEEAIFFFELVNEEWLLRAGGCGGLWAKTRNPEITSDAIICLANDGAC